MIVGICMIWFYLNMDCLLSASLNDAIQSVKFESPWFGNWYKNLELLRSNTTCSFFFIIVAPRSFQTSVDKTEKTTQLKF